MKENTNDIFHFINKKDVLEDLTPMAREIKTRMNFDYLKLKSFSIVKKYKKKIKKISY